MRSLPEWIGKNDDERVPDRVRLRIWERSDGHCACGWDLTGVVCDVDHCIPLSLGGQHRESNLQILCLPCHREKTRGEAAVRAKSGRIRKRHAGIRRKRKIRGWRRFDGTIVRAKEER